MATRKRNEFLDPLLSDDSEASEGGYDSEAAEESKNRSVKRRRKNETPQSESDEESENDAESADGGNGQEENEESPEPQPAQSSHPATKTKPLDNIKPKATAKANSKPKNKPGVIYLSTLPPYLKPSALRSMLEARGFAPITKIFLTPETPSASAPRRRSNKRKSYTDGWVEFGSKRTAKICAQTLNANIVGGKKGGWYHDDVWNMKYLRGFKWADLMEQVQRERAEREARQRIEDSRARKEEKVFVEGVERGRVVEGIRRKNEEKASRKRVEEGGLDVGGEVPDVNVRRAFRQNEVKRKDAGDAAALGEDTTRVLGKIF